MKSARTPILAGRAELDAVSRPTTRLCIHAALALFLSLPLEAAPEAGRMSSFISGGQKITIETYGSPAEAGVPSIIVLHGASGLPAGNRFIATIAAAIAAQGFRVHLLHYFQRTGTTRADDAAIQQNFVAWAGVVGDAIKWVRKEHPGAPIGMFGYSLGGYLTATTATRNPGIGAAVVLAGGLDPVSARAISHAPPVLILHGSEDTRVKVGEGEALAAALRGAGGRPELHIYPGEHHIMQMPSYLDVVMRSAAFFTSHLRRGESEAIPENMEKLKINVNPAR